MNYKLLVGIPLIIVVVFILIKSPEYWWLLLVIPLLFIKKQMRSIHKSVDDSMYDAEYQRIFDNPPADDSPVITTLDVTDSKEKKSSI